MEGTYAVIYGRNDLFPFRGNESPFAILSDITESKFIFRADVLVLKTYILLNPFLLRLGCIEDGIKHVFNQVFLKAVRSTHVMNDLVDINLCQVGGWLSVYFH